MATVKDLVSTAVTAVGNYLRDEAESPVGRANLAMGALLIVFAAVGMVPSVALQIVRILFNKPAPEWTAAIPLVALAFIIVFFWLSLKLIPPQPPR